MLLLEEWLFYGLLRRYVRRLSITQLEAWLTWFQIDLALKRKGQE